MKRTLLMVAILTSFYLIGFAQPIPTEERTALNGWMVNSARGQGDLRTDCWDESCLKLWGRRVEGYLSADDGSYAYSKILPPGRGILQLQLHDFRFNIPAGATIENIIVTARRFKNGKGSIKDHYAYLITKSLDGGFLPYGPKSADPKNFANVETAVIYSYSGTGTTSSWDTIPRLYQWTPELINDPAFGVRFSTFPVVEGAVVVYYDQVTITVEYSSKATLDRAPESNALTETTSLKTPNFFNISGATTHEPITKQNSPATEGQTISSRVVITQPNKLTLTAIPNPSSSYFTLNIYSGSNEVLHLRVLDVLGRIVEARNQVAPNTTIHVGNNLRPGIYLVEVVQGTKRQMLKLIRQ